MSQKSTLYVCYFGLREPLVQTQVLPYLRELVADGWAVHILTFEPDWPAAFPQAEQEARRSALASDGITWHARPYSKSHGVAAKLRDIAGGLVAARRIARQNGARIIHGRAHVGTAIACLAAAFSKRKVLFDIRGFNPEEYVDSGHWPAGGRKFRLLKMAERVMLWYASGFVILTHVGREHLFHKATHTPGDPADLYHLPDGRPVQVIPCCVDPARFQRATMDATAIAQLKTELGLADTSRIIAHVGALGGLYPEDRIVAVFAALYQNDPGTGFLILCQNDTSRLRALYAEAGLPPARLWVGKVTAAEVPRYVALADWGLSLKRESFSQLSCSPTKIPEYLLAGLPVLASQGIGDTDRLLLENRVGVVFNAWDDHSISAAVGQMQSLAADPELKSRCVQTAVAGFSLKGIGGPRYQAIYAELAGERA
jgi:glycosyltransferase involved in cell wall biosynthesis